MWQICVAFLSDSPACSPGPKKRVDDTQQEIHFIAAAAPAPAPAHVRVAGDLSRRTHQLKLLNHHSDSDGRLWGLWRGYITLLLRMRYGDADILLFCLPGVVVLAHQLAKSK